LISLAERSTYHSLEQAKKSVRGLNIYCELFFFISISMLTPTSFATFLFSLPIKKKEATNFLIVSFIYKE
jgi:hypothetical protein